MLQSFWIMKMPYDHSFYSDNTKWIGVELVMWYYLFPYYAQFARGIQCQEVLYCYTAKSSCKYVLYRFWSLFLLPLYRVKLWILVSGLNLSLKILVKNGHIPVHNTHSFKQNMHWIDIDYSLAYDSMMKEAEINAIEASYAVINLYSGVK